MPERNSPCFPRQRHKRIISFHPTFFCLCSARHRTCSTHSLQAVGRQEEIIIHQRTSPSSPSASQKRRRLPQITANHLNPLARSFSSITSALQILSILLRRRRRRTNERQRRRPSARLSYYS